MYANTLNNVRKYGAKVAAGASALGFSALALAQSTTGADVLAKVEEGMTQGEKIAAAVVTGLFVIFAVKLLWRSK